MNKFKLMFFIFLLCIVLPFNVYAQTEPCSDDADCDDSIACTDDSCDTPGPTGTCDNIENNSLCDDSAWCNGSETCDDVVGCEAGTTVDCDDSIDCTVDTCDETNDECDNDTDDSVCTRSKWCLNGSTCDGGGGSFEYFNCDITSVSGGPTYTICFAEQDCNDNYLTTDVDVSISGKGTIDVSSIDTDHKCFDGTLNGGFTGLPIVGDTVIQDSPTGCIEGSNPCPDDSVFCNGDEYCSNDNEECFTVSRDCSDNIDCTTDTCDEGDDECDHVVDNEECDDAYYCNGEETCSLTGCVAGTPIDCDDSIDCTSDVCDDDLDQCLNTVITYYCSDELYCNGFEECDYLLGCLIGTDPCDDADSCTTDVCVESSSSCTNTCIDITSPLNSCCDGSCGTDLQCNFCDENSDCDDDLYCNGTEICNVGTNLCEDGSSPDCSDGNTCTSDLCHEYLDGCLNLCNVAAPSDICCENAACQ